MRDTLKTQERILDANDPDTMASRSLLAKILLAENRPEDAVHFAQQAFDDQFRTLGPRHRDTQESLGSLGIALMKTGRYQEARKLYLDTIQKIGDHENSGNVPYLWYDLACLAAQTGRRDEAFDDLHHAIEAGFSDAPSMSVDNDLKSLRNDRRFDKLVASAKMESSASAPH
jgi:tetratricopeptide (TPR) repeat protein